DDYAHRCTAMGHLFDHHPSFYSYIDTYDSAVGHALSARKRFALHRTVFTSARGGYSTPGRILPLLWRGSRGWLPDRLLCAASHQPRPSVTSPLISTVYIPCTLDETCRCILRTRRFGCLVSPRAISRPVSCH